MRIIIKTARNDSFPIDVPESTRIREVKRILAKRYEVDFIDYHFKFDGLTMRDDNSLEYYGIEDEDVIFAGPMMMGGGPPYANQTYSSNIHCTDKRGEIGEYYMYKIKGSDEGTVWGDGIYTDDSNIAKAAVLEGKCKLGEERDVCIKIIEGKSSYGSCTKNGISTNSYGYWDGSYIFS